MRQIININNNWYFSKMENILGESIHLPHTWNAADGQDGGNDYYRGTCYYTYYFSPPNIKENERIYLELNGVAMSATIYLNNVKLFHHAGGYSTFRIDLTDYLSKENILKIAVDNNDNNTVYPQKADFTFYGGIYRDVNLIIVPEEHFELDYYGTSGIKVTTIVDLETNTASITIETWQNAQTVTMSIGGQTQVVSSENGHAIAHFELADVHLWDGLNDPYLYTATASLESGDTINTRFGCREFKIDAQKGFLLNGRSYPLRGVSRHQDYKGIGNALTLEFHQKDIDIIQELGANSLRLAHYQHSQEFYNLCDEKGLIVWAEIPYITMHMKNGRENTLSQMKELVIQNYNHPSIICWGLSNEITAASAVNEDLLENHHLLNDLCHQLDSTRPTTMANVFMLETDSPILDIPDINSYNLYFGWYIGELSQTDNFFDEYHKKYPNKAIGFSEYGADANPQYQSPTPEKGDYTETYQCIYHEHMLNMIEQRPWLWSTYVWNLFDFAADGRNEGGKNGENQKGLITFDRKTKKDAFYLYKAAWNKSEAFVHLCGKRYVERTEELTEIKVYSNQSSVTLYVDGNEVETLIGHVIFTFHVPLIGTHTIEVKTDNCSDAMQIKKVSTPNPAYTYVKTSPVLNWFDAEELDNSYFSVSDTVGEIRSNPEGAAIINKMLEEGAKNHGDVAESVSDNPALQRMINRITFISLLKQSGADEEKIKQLNRILQRIKK